ncbi:YggT family protein [Helicobacter salomonis]|uniref:YggT family protein n=1 Tax=Helicobacter salomonis TaxID=56878 RepID=UPI000CF133BD|nr:YggT family protein [Helicobacter salomonis]
MVVSTILGAFATILHSLITIYTWVIIIASILSFIKPDPNNPLVQILYRLTEPVFAKVRSLLPFLVFNGLDLSPLAVIILLQFVDMTVVKLLFVYAQG